MIAQRNISFTHFRFLPYLIDNSKVIITMNKKLTIAISLIFAFSGVSAQVNPKQGYIITNEGDTIRGTIDYRSDVRNARECRSSFSGLNSNYISLCAGIRL